MANIDSHEAAELRAEIEELASVEYLTETNSGTYGPEQARRKCGVGDPQFADRNVYETVGGKRRETGCDAGRMPGRVRRCNREALSRDRRRLAKLRLRLSDVLSAAR